ncbi:MAG: type II toxin-antitoxin system RelE/ParE family toxin [Desulfobacteraceae bacterium]|jgi:mRNA interferase RelE/StbE|nr:type II toxin-antitoxin system RelE/ParE family toxin [Desulfobacteraceae bacterium]
MFEICYAKSVAKDIKYLDVKTVYAIKRKIESLKNFPDMSNIKRLSAHPLADFRLRVGEYRILFDMDWNKTVIFILKIGYRKDVY